MRTLILTTINGGFTAQLDNNGNLSEVINIDCSCLPAVKQHTDCPITGNARYIIIDEDKNALTNPVEADEFELDGVAVDPNDILTFLDTVCPIAGTGSGTTQDVNVTNDPLNVNVVNPIDVSALNQEDTQLDVLQELEDINTALANGIDVNVTNQINISGLQSTLDNILIAINAVNANTDQAETLLSDIITALGNLDSDDDGTALSAILTELTNVVSELQDVDANTTNLESILTAIQGVVAGNATAANQVLQLAELAVISQNTLDTYNALKCNDVTGQLLGSNSDVAPNFQQAFSGQLLLQNSAGPDYIYPITGSTVFASVQELVDGLNELQDDFIFTYISDTEILFISNTEDISTITDISWGNDDANTTTTFINVEKTQACLQIETRNSIKSIREKLEDQINVKDKDLLDSINNYLSKSVSCWFLDSSSIPSFPISNVIGAQFLDSTGSQISQFNTGLSPNTFFNLTGLITYLSDNSTAFTFEESNGGLLLKSLDEDVSVLESITLLGFGTFGTSTPTTTQESTQCDIIDLLKDVNSNLEGEIDVNITNPFDNDELEQITSGEQNTTFRTNITSNTTLASLIPTGKILQSYQYLVTGNGASVDAIGVSDGFFESNQATLHNELNTDIIFVAPTSLNDPTENLGIHIVLTFKN